MTSWLGLNDSHVWHWHCLCPGGPWLGPDVLRPGADRGMIRCQVIMGSQSLLIGPDELHDLINEPIMCASTQWALTAKNSKMSFILTSRVLRRWKKQALTWLFTCLCLLIFMCEARRTMAKTKQSMTICQLLGFDYDLNTPISHDSRYPGTNSKPEALQPNYAHVVQGPW